MRVAFKLVGLILMVVGFAVSQRATAAEPKKGGTVVMATRAQVQGFDAITMRVANRESTMAGALIFSNFFTLNDKGERVPDLATSVESSQDGTVWRLKLRPGLKFSNGAPFTVGDVVAHFKRILDPTKNQAFSAALGQLKEVVAIDDATL